MENPTRLALAVAAYKVLLRIPYDTVLRVQAHEALCLCRDTIADETGQSGEDVQTMYEQMYRPPRT